MHRCAWRGTEVQATRSWVPAACRGNVDALDAIALSSRPICADNFTSKTAGYPGSRCSHTSSIMTCHAQPVEQSSGSLLTGCLEELVTRSQSL